MNALIWTPHTFFPAGFDLGNFGGNHAGPVFTKVRYGVTLFEGQFWERQIIRLGIVGVNKLYLERGVFFQKKVGPCFLVRIAERNLAAGAGAEFAKKLKRLITAHRVCTWLDPI
jgi:hypothetical protein